MIQVGKRLHASTDRSGFGEWIGLWLFDHDHQGNRLAVKSIAFEPMVEGAYLEATARIPRENAQELMDELWQCGLRPTLGRQSEGVTAAQGRHLEDLRAIAFAKLSIDKPA